MVISSELGQKWAAAACEQWVCEHWAEILIVPLQSTSLTCSGASTNSVFYRQAGCARLCVCVSWYLILVGTFFFTVVVGTLVLVWTFFLLTLLLFHFPNPYTCVQCWFLLFPFSTTVKLQIFYRQETVKRGSCRAAHVQMTDTSVACGGSYSSWSLRSRTRIHCCTLKSGADVERLWNCVKKKKKKKKWLPQTKRF